MITFDIYYEHGTFIAVFMQLTYNIDSYPWLLNIQMIDAYRN